MAADDPTTPAEEPAQPTVPTKVCPHCGTQSQTAADKCPSCGKSYAVKKKGGGCLKWGAISLLALIVLIAGCSALLAGGSDGDKETTASPPAATEGVTDEEEAPPPAAEEEQGFGDGTHNLGEDIAPGTYRSDGDGTCYWARLAGFSGELDDIRANGNNAPEIVTISQSDAGFETQGCGSWAAVAETAPASPAAEFEDGTYQVGAHIAPGTYRADGEGTCYWARLSNFSHSGVTGIITNGNNPTTIQIAPSDKGFTAFGCGKWTR